MTEQADTILNRFGGTVVISLKVQWPELPKPLERKVTRAKYFYCLLLSQIIAFLLHILKNIMADAANQWDVWLSFVQCLPKK